MFPLDEEAYEDCSKCSHLYILMYSKKKKKENNNMCDQKCKRIKAFILPSTLTLVKSSSFEIYFLSSPVVSLKLKHFYAFFIQLGVLA